ncbi:TRAP transporter small permease [Nocardioides sp. YIM 152315]|uniref:TRAP transporter small permease n=1 Tax=Nocardioides sp. YIM 152315 TaxID=3031760 RepID=UPI0023DA7346|nr:TRAP transporter small permease [Nocardioides sp. YIM 152315]MDF1605363.1 TRAP transporter small permease [Nocardioides sp. YIM 152315]
MTASTPTAPRTPDGTPDRRLPAWLGRVARVLTAVELTIGVAALLLIFGLVLLQAAQRYLPIDGWPWTGELARFCLVWLTFVVAGALVTRNSHISIEMIDMVPGDPLRRVVRVVSCLIVALVGVGLCAEAWELVQTQDLLKSPAMRMPMSWLYAISLIGFVSVVVRSLIAAVEYAVLGVPEPTYDDLADHEMPTA